MKVPMPTHDSFSLLLSLNAPPRLMHHARMVLGVAEELSTALHPWGVSLDTKVVLAGAVLHDAGKVAVPDELSASGHQHEEQGRRLLLAHGVPPEVARICVSHAQWATMDCSLEELLVALADKLWKGKREDDLERRVVAQAAERSGRALWEVFTDLDSRFDSIAAHAPLRLAESRHVPV